MSSLRARLLASLLGGVVLIGAAGGWVVYRNALAEADAFFDYHLRQTALILRDQPVEYLLSQQLAPANATYDFVVQVWTLDGARVYLSRPHTDLPEATTLGFSTVATSEGRWRVYGAQALTRVVQVAQPMSVRSRRAAELALRTLAPFALLLPLLALFIWLAVGHALKPLARLTGLVKARRELLLEPLPPTPLPEEVRPLVAALNELLARLNAARERERAFMADAAHELRTPLTALSLQLGTLARAGSEAERAAAMKELGEGVQRAIRLVEQLLALAREAPRQSPPHTQVALEPLAREIVAELVPLADARHVDLGLSAAQPLTVSGDPDALRTLLRNLVDNAVRYSGEGGRVDVAVEADGAGRARLVVSDRGPGIPPQERTRVFDRFYRRAGSGAPGSGLGLAIVKAIADAHGATLDLGDGPEGRGLKVVVTFAPGAAAAPAA
jgi:two-component system OmpR family sensor kinase